MGRRPGQKVLNHSKSCDSCSPAPLQYLKRCKWALHPFFLWFCPCWGIKPSQMLAWRCSVNIWMGPEHRSTVWPLFSWHWKATVFLPCCHVFPVYPLPSLGLLKPVLFLRVSENLCLWLVTVDGHGFGFCWWFFLGSCKFWFSKTSCDSFAI